MQFALQQTGPQRLERRPEPAQVSAGVDQVAQYDRVMGTKLAIAYAAGIDLLHRVRPEPGQAPRALDLACGPGHFTLSLARYLGYRRVTGVDLSAPMVEVARANAAGAGRADAVTFEVGDATNLPSHPSGAFDLVSLTDAAHHLPSPGVVTAALAEMERLASPTGLVFVMDLARLRTQALTEAYVNALASDYRERGLPAFFDDFRHSMFAAWTAAELAAMTPTKTHRAWWHLVPRGVPSVQFLLGLPQGRERLYLRDSFTPSEHPLLREWEPRWRTEVSVPWAAQTQHEYSLLRTGIRFAVKRLVRRP